MEIEEKNANARQLTRPASSKQACKRQHKNQNQIRRYLPALKDTFQYET